MMFHPGLFFDRFYTNEQALEAIYQSQRTVLGDNVLKVSMWYSGIILLYIIIIIHFWYTLYIYNINCDDNFKFNNK